MTIDRKNKRLTILQIRLPVGRAILLSALIMGVLIAAVYLLNIPNPNMILIAGLVVCSAIMGYPGGITAGTVMFFYTLFFFSTDHSFLSFTGKNAQKVFVSLVGIVADMFFVCELKRNESMAFRKIEKLTEKLIDDNEKLQEASSIDELTGIQNRFALRNDYETYLGRELFMMMLDIDNFKAINDTCGHEEGDRVLRETGRLLAELFGVKSCYRYGGDEFLVIQPETSETEFREKLNALLKARPGVNFGRSTEACAYSVGYTHGTPRSNDQLRQLFVESDMNMYAAKRRGKNLIVGGSSRSAG